MRDKELRSEFDRLKRDLTLMGLCGTGSFWKGDHTQLSERVDYLREVVDQILTHLGLKVEVKKPQVKIKYNLVKDGTPTEIH